MLRCRPYRCWSRARAGAWVAQDRMGEGRSGMPMPCLNAIPLRTPGAGAVLRDDRAKCELHIRSFPLAGWLGDQ
jgi:hypothetical protein